MSDSYFIRSQLLIGEDNMNKLKKSTIAILGLGGVGGSCAEALCRAGIGNLILIDNDKIDISNINRQTIATTLNIGKLKTHEMYLRLKSINPNINIFLENQFYLPENSQFLYNYNSNYIIDAIDTIKSKIHLAIETNKKNINFISCMGMGNRLDPSLIKSGSLKDTVGSGCVISKIIRHKLKKLNLSLNFKVVYSTEQAKKNVVSNNINGHHSPGSLSCVPPVAGYILASQVINSIISQKTTDA